MRILLNSKACNQCLDRARHFLYLACKILQRNGASVLFFHSIMGKTKTIITWIIRIFPRFALVAGFPAFGAGCMFSRVWRRLHVAPPQSDMTDLSKTQIPPALIYIKMSFSTPELLSFAHTSGLKGLGKRMQTCMIGHS